MVFILGIVSFVVGYALCTQELVGILSAAEVLMCLYMFSKEL